MAMVSGGSLIGQLLLVASLPLVARLYDPADVGRFGAALAASQVAGIVITARLQQILPRVEKPNRWPIIRLVLILTVALSPVAGVAFAVLQGSTDMIAPVVLLVVSLNIYNLCTFVALSERDFRAVVALRIVNGVVTAAAQVAGGFLAPSLSMLIVTYAVGSLAGCLPMLLLTARVRDQRASVTLREVVRSERVGAFALTVGSTALMSNLSLALPLFFITYQFGAAAAGAFFLARRMLMLPTQLVASTVSDVSYSLIARRPTAEIEKHVRSWLRRLWVMSVLVVFAGFAAGPVVQRLVGDEYDNVMMMVWIMTLPAAAQLVGTSMSNILLALNMELARMLWNLVELVALTMAFGACLALDTSLLGTVSVLAAILVGWYLGLLGITLNGLKRRERAE